MWRKSWWWQLLGSGWSSQDHALVGMECLRVLRLLKCRFSNKKSNTKSPWTPTTHRKIKVLHPQCMGPIPPTNQGNVGSHGSQLIEKNKVLPHQSWSVELAASGFPSVLWVNPMGWGFFPNDFPVEPVFRGPCYYPNRLGPIGSMVYGPGRFRLHLAAKFMGKCK